jgi:hypothetical protein
MPPVLPAETFDRIVDFLYDDQNALTTCSLVSSTLTPSARHHLFSDLALSPSDINGLMELLDVPWCTIPPAVIGITVGKRRGRTHVLAQAKQEEDLLQGFHVPEDLKRMIGRFSQLRRLRFQDLNISNIPPPFMHIIYNLPSLEQVEVFDTTVFVSEPLLRYISSLTRLRSLSILGLECEQAITEPIEQRALSRFNIPLLDVGKSSTEVLDWLKAQSFIPKVDVFHVDLGATPTELGAMNEYATFLGPSTQGILVKWPTASAG